MSLPQKSQMEAEHPLNFAPSPNKVAPAGKPKLDRIDHENFRIQPGPGGGEGNMYANLPSPTQGKRNKQLEPLGGPFYGGQQRGL